MILLNQISSVHIASGMGTKRLLLAACDRWGKHFFIDASRWMNGRKMLTAYKKDGLPLWKPGKANLQAQIYCRENITKVEGV